MSDSDLLTASLETRVQRRENRRAFFAAAVGAGAFMYANAAAAQTAPTDADVLNFALNLEYLEANFYYYAAFGTPIPDASTDGPVGTRGAATGGRAVAFTDPVVRQYAREIAFDELAHVDFLRRNLASARVAQPTIDVGTSPTGAFSSAARAARLIGAGESFDPYANDENFLLAAFIFEDVGVTAYKGAAALISNKTFLEAAAGILAVEAYHAAIVRTTLYAKGLAVPSLRAAAGAISDARDSLDGSSNLDEGIAPVEGFNGTQSNIVPLNGQGLAYGRTAGQVLNIVYLNSAEVSMGGFFPNGVNGTIKTSAASAPAAA